MLRQLKYLFEYAVVRLFVGLGVLLPWAVLPALARRMAPWAARLLPRRARLVLDNIRRAFPQKEGHWHSEIAAQFWQNIMLTVLEVLKASSCGECIKENVVLDNREILDEALRQGRGALLHSGHFANWELAALGIAAQGYPVVGLVRTQKNLYVDHWYNTKRCRFGMQTLNHHQAVRETQEWLGKNGLLGILMDHNLHQGGIFVDFFGRPAAATTITALLHYRTQCPLVGVYQYRKEGRLHVRFERLQPPLSSGAAGRKEKTAMLTQWLTGKIEDLVREDPANWLWGHNRWKRSSEGV